MLAFINPPSSSPTASYLPPNPSPLSPRNPNITTSRWPRDPYMSSTNPATHCDQNENSSATQTPFSKRPIKRAPLQKQDDLKERRRTNFLRNVRDKRDERRYEARGEDVMRMEFVRKRRAFEAEMGRSAPVEGKIEEEEELPGWSQQESAVQMQSLSQVLPEEEVEEFVREEEEELEALLEFMPQERGRRDNEVEEMVACSQDELWSDGADYDALFEEVLGLEEGGQNTMHAGASMGDGRVRHVQQHQRGDDDEMDMS